MATINVFSVGGILRRIEEKTSRNGSSYVHLCVGVEDYNREQGKCEMVLCFAFFHEQADAARAALSPGDVVLVNGKFRTNQNGYLDTQATGFVVVRKAVQAPPMPQEPKSQYGAQPQNVRPMSSTGAQYAPLPPQNAPQYGAQRQQAQQPPIQAQVDQAIDDTPF